MSLLGVLRRFPQPASRAVSHPLVHQHPLTRAGCTNIWRCPCEGCDQYGRCRSSSPTCGLRVWWGTVTSRRPADILCVVGFLSRYYSRGHNRNVLAVSEHNLGATSYDLAVGSG